MKMKDQLHRELNFNKTPKRIVCLVPSQTELLVDMGLEDQIVGLTKFCVHPPHLKQQKKVVGGTKKVHYDRIRDLQPDIILCNKEENTQEMVTELEKIAQVHISNVIRVEDSLELIEQYGILFSKQEAARSMINEIKTALADFKNLYFPEKKVAYLIWKNPWMAAGGDTFIHTLMQLNGWLNVFQNKDGRYPQTRLEEIRSLEPDLILLSSEPYPFKEKHIQEVLESCNGCRVELVDGEYFSWYGSRILPALKYFEHLQIKLSNSL